MSSRIVPRVARARPTEEQTRLAALVSDEARRARIAATTAKLEVPPLNVICDSLTSPPPTCSLSSFSPTQRRGLDGYQHLWVLAAGPLLYWNSFLTIYTSPQSILFETAGDSPVRSTTCGAHRSLPRRARHAWTKALSGGVWGDISFP